MTLILASAAASGFERHDWLTQVIVQAFVGSSMSKSGTTSMGVHRADQRRERGEQRSFAAMAIVGRQNRSTRLPIAVALPVLADVSSQTC